MITSQDVRADLSALVSKINDKYKIIGQKTVQAVSTACALIVNSAKTNVKSQGSGYLRNSIDFNVIQDGNNVNGIVGARAKYAPCVEFGTAPHAKEEGHDDFVASITDWGNKNGLTKSEIESVMYFIRKNGTHARPFLFPAIRANSSTVNEILQGLNK